jgi:hypothetical protein
MLSNISTDKFSLVYSLILGATISKTTSKLSFDAVIKDDGIIEAVVYDTKFVLLILLSAFVIIVGIEPVPFYIISNTTSNPLPTLFISDVDGAIDDVS